MWAVPRAARIMADWGAEVIKVEPPKGEPWRYVGPGYEMPAGPDNNPIFEVENINKKSVALNLKTPEGQARHEDTHPERRRIHYQHPHQGPGEAGAEL